MDYERKIFCLNRNSNFLKGGEYTVQNALEISRSCLRKSALQFLYRSRKQQPSSPPQKLLCVKGAVSPFQFALLRRCRACLPRREAASHGPGWPQACILPWAPSSSLPPAFYRSGPIPSNRCIFGVEDESQIAFTGRKRPWPGSRRAEPRPGKDPRWLSRFRCCQRQYSLSRVSRERLQQLLKPQAREGLQ